MCGVLEQTAGGGTMKYTIKAFLHWLCIYAGLILILWVLFAILVVEMDGSYMWSENDYFAIRTLAFILSLYVTKSVQEACAMAASIVRCKDCRYLSPFFGIDPQEIGANKGWRGIRVGHCVCDEKPHRGILFVEANEYCIHGKRRRKNGIPR